MSSYSGGRIELYCDNATVELENHFLECYGIDIDDYGFFEREINDMDAMDVAEELDNIYAIASLLFGNTYLHYSEEDNDENTDWYSGYEASYNEDNSGKKETRLYNYCYGDNTANGENCWIILKSEIEEKAKKKNISIQWNESYDEIIPEGEEFEDLCDKVLEEHGGLEELSTTRKVEKINIKSVNDEMLRKIVNEAKRKKYSDLVKIIEERQ